MAKISGTDRLSGRLASVAEAARKLQGQHGEPEPAVNSNRNPEIPVSPGEQLSEPPLSTEPVAVEEDIHQDSGEMRYMPVDILTPGYNARSIDPDMDPEEWDGFLQSIQSAGLIQPIVVAPDPATEGQYRVIAGNRRFLAIKMLGWDTVPVVVKQLSPMDQVATMLAENLARKDMNLYEEARGFEELIAAGMAPHQIAQRVQRSPSYISLARKCIRHDSLARALENGQINRSAAIELARLLTPDGQEKFHGSIDKLLLWIQKKQPTLGEIRTACQEALEDKPITKTVKEKQPRRYRVFVERIQDTLLHEMPKRWDGLSIDDLNQIEHTLSEAMAAVATRRQRALRENRAFDAGEPEESSIPPAPRA